MKEQKSLVVSKEVQDATRNKYLSKGWRSIGCANGFAFLSPCGNWLNYIDVETGEKWYLNRKHAQSRGFHVALREYEAPVMAIAE
jgi:hypothetical protein